MEKFKITREAKLRLDNWARDKDYIDRDTWINMAIVKYMPEVREVTEMWEGEAVMRIHTKYLKKISPRCTWCVICPRKGAAAFGHTKGTQNMVDEVVAIKELKERRDALDKLILRIEQES